jgi:hypothetical protein
MNIFKYNVANFNPWSLLALFVNIMKKIIIQSAYVNRSTYRKNNNSINRARQGREYSLVFVNRWWWVGVCWWLFWCLEVRGGGDEVRSWCCGASIWRCWRVGRCFGVPVFVLHFVVVVFCFLTSGLLFWFRGSWCRMGGE